MLRPVGVPSISRIVNIPEPAGITAPLNEKPRTVPSSDETVKPASAAAPPDSEVLVALSILNWNPLISVSLLYPTIHFPLQSFCNHIQLLLHNEYSISS